MSAVVCVLDCSVAMTWCFEDEARPDLDALQDRLTTESAAVPMHWWLEVANALLIGQRRKRLDEQKLTMFIDSMMLLRFDKDEATAAHAWHETLLLSQRHGLTIYDAAYLELAIRRRLPLATLDVELARAARVAGVSLFVS